MTRHGLSWIGLILVVVLGFCTACPAGKCGEDCASSCPSACMYCDVENCSCDTCPDGKWGLDCTKNCSSNCYSGEGKKACNISTGACADGCVKGRCHPEKRCDTPCGKNCTKCDFYDCKCMECKAGHYGQFCECGHCSETVKKCNTSAIACIIVVIVAVSIYGAVSAWPRCLKLRRTNKDDHLSHTKSQTSLGLLLSDRDSPAPHNIDRLDAHLLEGNDGSCRYILTTLPSTQEHHDKFLRMVTENDINVIVFTSSNGSRVLGRYLDFWRSPPGLEVVDITPGCSGLQSHNNGTRKTTYLYHYDKWFETEGFCQFMKHARGNPHYLTKPIVVCSSEGEGPSFLYCVLDCLMDKKPSGGFEKHLDECIERLLLERNRSAWNKRNKKRLKECCRHLLSHECEIDIANESDDKATTKQSFCRTIRAIPITSCVRFSMLIVLFVSSIFCLIFIVAEC